MHKIEWNELWPKVVECYFKKLLLDNLFHKHLSSTHAGNPFFYFFNIIFQYAFFFHLILFYFFQPFHLIFLRSFHLILLSFFQRNFIIFLSLIYLISISFNHHNLTNIFIHTVIYIKYFYFHSSTSQIYRNVSVYCNTLCPSVCFFVPLMRIIFFSVT